MQFWEHALDRIIVIFDTLNENCVLKWDILLVKKICNDQMENLATTLRTTAWEATSRVRMKNVILAALTPSMNTYTKKRLYVWWPTTSQ